MYFIYRLLSNIIAPVIRIIVFVRMKNSKEDPLRVKERFGIALKDRPEGDLIWFHAASVGESLSILTLIKTIKAKYEAVNILVTTSTLTSARMMESTLPDGCIHQFSVHDVNAWVKAFLHHWSPNLVFFVEQEIWPNMIKKIKQREVPFWLINASISQSSFEKWLIVKNFAKEVLMQFNGIFPKSKTDADRLKQLGLTNIMDIANLKYSSQPLSYKKEDLKELKGSIGKRHFWLATSTHPGEEALIEQAHKIILKQFPDALCIIAPRHPNRADRLSKELDLKTQQRSLKPKVIKDTQIYIADTMGELGLFYELANFAFVGGSLTPIGGHNIIEPAKQHCVAIVGPYVSNFQDLLEEFKNSKACITIENVDELAQIVIKYLKDDSKLKEISMNANELIENQTNIINTYMQLIEKHLRA